MKAMTGKDRPVKYYFPFYTAVYLAELGDLDRAFAELNKTYDGRLYYITWMKTDPCMDRLRNDPRFEALLKKIAN